MRTVVDGKKLFLCLKVCVAATGPPNIVTVLCIYCSSNSTHTPPWGINKVYSILFASVSFYSSAGEKVSRDSGSVASDPALHVKTQPRPCPAKLVSRNCCRYCGNGQFVVVSSVCVCVCSGGVTRVSNCRPPTSKKRGVLFSFDVRIVKSFLGWRRPLSRLLTTGFRSMEPIEDV